MRYLLSALLLIACNAEAVPHEAVSDGITSLHESLDHAVQASAEGHVEQARTAWRAAHISWEQTVRKALKPHLSHVELTQIEYRLALIRNAMETDGGKPQAQVDLFHHDLDEALRSLPSTP